MNIRMTLCTLAAALTYLPPGVAAGDETTKIETSSNFIQYGEMHEAIGQQKSHGRVLLSDLVKRPNVYAVGALKDLAGEVTVENGKIIATKVDADGKVETISKASTLQATMLAGASVDSWATQPVTHDVNHADFDTFIANAAAESKVDTEKPFAFMVEGEFTNVRLHVINGACPVHARMKATKLDTAHRPFEQTFATIKGKLIGILAKDAVGKLTHPATMTHVHIIYTDEQTGQLLTAHAEQMGLAAGASLKLPQ